MSESSAVQAMSKVDGWLSEDEARLLYRCTTDALYSYPPGRVVEVGSYKGKSTVVLATALLDSVGKTREVLAIDPHEGHLTGLNVSPTFEEFKRNVEAAGLSKNVVPVLGTTADFPKGDPISVLFLDGLHDYESVREDYERLYPFVVVGGLIAFHDYENKDYPGVKKLVDEKVLDGQLEVHARLYGGRREDTLIVTRKRERISVIIPTCGRSSLAAAIDSVVVNGLHPTDEVLVVGDGSQPGSAEIVRSLRKSIQYQNVKYSEYGPTRMVGAAQRQSAMARAIGTHFMFLDDDDLSVDHALDWVRIEIRKNPVSPMIFKEQSMVRRHAWGVVWKTKEVRCGNVGTQGIVVPNFPGRLGTWGKRYEAEYDFLRSTLDLYPGRDNDVVWVDRIIACLY